MRVGDWPRYHYRGDVLRIVDGDTIRVRLGLGLRTYREVSLRLAGINAPEINTGDAGERERGLASRQALTEILTDHVGEYRTVYVRTYRDRKSFDRYVADVLAERFDGELFDLAAAMVGIGAATAVGAAGGETG